MVCVAKGTSVDGGAIGYYIWKDTDDKIYFRLRSASTNHTAISDTVVQAGVWYHIACTYEGLSNKDD